MTYELHPRATAPDVLALLEVWHASQQGWRDRSRLIEGLRFLAVDAWGVVEQVSCLTDRALRLYCCAAAGLPSMVLDVCASPTCRGSGSFSQHPRDEASRCEACHGSGVVAISAEAKRAEITAGADADVAWIRARLYAKAAA